MREAVIFDVIRNSFVDGPGIRTAVFFKGCNLHCAWCHNPESQLTKPQMLFYRDKCTDCGKCRTACPNRMQSCDLCGKCALFCPNNARSICGKTVTVEKLLKEILKDKMFYELSGGGVTFSGGECMLQVDFLCDILKKCKENGIHTAVDTAGCVPWSSFEKILPYTDLFLYDVKCASDVLHKQYTGVSNRLILENLHRLSDSFDGDIIIRIPVIGGANDSADEMKNISAILQNIKHIGVEFLPYHKMGEHKYAAIGKQATSFYAPSSQQMDSYMAIINGK